ncbi:MAG: oxidoreductase [Rhodobacteraceae bacterium]|nr:oxidoreductase [Paracoccaceae bacterium]
MGFLALVVDKNEEGKTSGSVQELNIEDLPEGDVTVKVDYSTVNYKDGLCLGSGGGLVRNYPHVPGIDFAGTVMESRSDGFIRGDRVVLTGWRVGEVWWGGYSQVARIKSEWLVKLPENMSTKTAMIVGTAGLTAMLAIDALENQGMKKDNGPVLVTGATGGVGSIATLLLSQMGYEVAGVTGKSDSGDYLKELGASKVIPRTEIDEVTKRPLEKELWAGCVDAVGGAMLARVLGQMKYGTSVAAVGLAGGAQLPTTVIPFLLRGVNLLGIDSVMRPISDRVSAWSKINQYLDISKLENVVEIRSLADLPDLGKSILKGEIRGRTVIDVNG